MKTFKGFFALLLLAAALLPRSASAVGLEAALGVWNQDPRGHIAYNPLTGTDRLSIEDDLKYGDKTKVMGRVKIEPPLFFFPSLYLMATPMEFDGSGSKTLNFKFGDTTFDVTQAFTSKVKLDHYDIGLYYGIPGLKMLTAGILNVELGLDARIVDFEAEITGRDSATGLTKTESKQATIPLPLVYVGAQVRPVDFISLEGEARGISYGGNYHYDLIGRVKVKPIGPFFVAGGYRYEKLRIEDYDLDVNAEFRGPFGEVGVEF